jgi:hypothetical protein
LTIDSISVAPISVLTRTGGAGEISSETKLYFLSSRLRIIMLRVVEFVDKSRFHRCQKAYDTPELKIPPPTNMRSIGMLVACGCSLTGVRMGHWIWRAVDADATMYFGVD